MVLVSLIAHGGARDAVACSCVASGPPCQAAWDADAIVAGTVRSIEVSQEEVAGSTRIIETVILFDVDQPLVNAVAGRVDIVSTGLSTCDYRFTRGQKYLVYASKREDGRWTTSICSRTRPLGQAAEDLRACVHADFTMHAESTAYGIVVDKTGQPVAGVSVEAVAEELAGYQPKAIHPPAGTDHQGRFSFDRLPPGAYVFGINITRQLYTPPSGLPIFLPGTGAATAAAVFNLNPGDRTDVGTIRLPN